MRGIRMAASVDNRGMRAGRRYVEPQTDRVAVSAEVAHAAAKAPVAVRNRAGLLPSNRIRHGGKISVGREIEIAYSDACLRADCAVRRCAVQLAGYKAVHAANVAFVSRFGGAARHGRCEARARRQGRAFGKQPVAVLLRQEPGVVFQPLRCIGRGGDRHFKVRDQLLHGRYSNAAAWPLLALSKGRGGGRGKGRGQHGQGQETECE